MIHNINERLLYMPFKLTLSKWRCSRKITYAIDRIVVKKAGNLVGIYLKPHDLRRHAATYASRSGTLLEIVSKVLLRHSNLSITQIYLGKISNAEAIR